MENKNQKNEDWVRFASKTRPGHFYMFNKATGETQWLPFKQKNDESKHRKLEIQPQVLIKKSSTTPAQDRLKRLQRNLKLNQIRSQSINFTRKSPDVEILQKQEQENSCQELHSTNQGLKTHKKTNRKSSNCLLSKRKELRPPFLEEESTLISSESLDNTHFASSSTSPKSSSAGIAINSEPESLESNPINNVESKEKNNSKFNFFRSDIMNKLKEIWKIPFNMSRKTSQEKACAKEKIMPNLVNVAQFKPKRKKHNDHHLNLTTAKKTICHLKESNEKLYSCKFPANKTEIVTVENLNIPSCSQGSANLRLKRLQQSLISQNAHQKSSTTENNSEVSKKASNILCRNNNVKHIHHTDHNFATNSLCNTSNNTLIRNEVEAMDWQSCVKDDEVLIEVSNVCPAPEIEKSKKFLLDKDHANKNDTMADIYDTVNENLLRLSAEKQSNSSNSTKQWRKDFYYFIVDTNVLLNDLTFIEDLTKMELCDTKGSMLYIPYSVLQELDKLKMRSGCQEGVKTRAIRVIKYLNSKFENNFAHLKAQSAIDERRRIVDVNSPDDSIINCCLQAKEYVQNLLLLTEDVNLRNKAICNNILVSTKSHLVSKCYNASDTKDSSCTRKLNF